MIYALYIGTSNFQLGFRLGLFAFTAAVLGGIGNLTGAVLGGILLGMIAAYNDGFGDARWTTTIIFSILILILVFRPSGLLGEQTPEGQSDRALRRVAALARAHWRGRTRAASMILAGAAALVVLPYPYWYRRGPASSSITLDMLGLKLDIVIVIAVYVMLALGLNIVVGYAGLLDLGYVAFYALGAYTRRLVRLRPLHRQRRLPLRLDDAPERHRRASTSSFWLILLLAGLIAAVAGIIIGWPTLRLRGDYLAIVTLGFGEIIPDVFRNADALPVPAGVRRRCRRSSTSAHVNLTNGVRGIKPLDRPGFGEQHQRLRPAACFPTASASSS